MKSFTLTFTVSKEVEATVEAENLDQAQNMAKEYTPHDFGLSGYTKIKVNTIEEKTIPYAHLKATK